MSLDRAVIFDLDDTLYLERDFVESGYRAVAAWLEQAFGFSAEAVFSALLRQFDTGDRGHVFDEWAQRHLPAEKGLVQRLIEVYREHKPRISLLPEVLPMLEELRRGCRLGIVTDGYRMVQERKIEVLGLRGCMEAIVLSDQWGRSAWKPSPRPFQALLSQLGELSPARAIYVADNPAKDFLGAKKAGMDSIRVRHPAGLHASEKAASPEAEATLTVDRLGEIPNLLQTWRWTDK